MEIKAKASLDCVNYPIPKKVTFGQNVAACLDAESKIFINLPVSTVTLLDTTNALNDAEQAAMTGDKVAIQKRKKLNALWNDQFRQTAAYISLVADGNVEQIKSTGFAPTKTTRQKKPKIASLLNFQAKVESAKGTATASCKRAKGANGYVLVAAPDGVKMSMLGNDMLVDVNGIIVRVKTGTQSAATFTGLQSEQRVNVSMFAFNASGNSALTDAQSVLPQ